MQIGYFAVGIGPTVDPALRRVAEYGDGWIGFNVLPDQAAEKIKRIEELLKTNGRSRSDVKLAGLGRRKPPRMPSCCRA